MARYGREHGTGGRGGRRRMHEPGYDVEYGRVRGYGSEGGYGVEYMYGDELGYGEEFGWAEEVGYGEGTGYGAGIHYERERYAPEEYDYEFGGRGWPYRESRWERGRRPMRHRGRGMRHAYDWEMGRREGFEMGYGAEYRRPGMAGYRRGRAGVSRRMYRPGPRTRFGYERRGTLGYEGEFAGRGWGSRAAERGYERGYGRGYGEDIERGTMGRADYDIEITSRAGMRSGHTPPDRWPDVGHDVDRRPPRELRMSDDDIREAVLENLFQDTWVDPDRIDVEVENGVVTLTGEVRDFMEARYAWDDAWESAGVRGVINNLTVRTDRPQESMELPQTAGGYKPGTEIRR